MLWHAVDDTWGVAGPDFLVGYIVGAVAVFAAALILHAAARRPRGTAQQPAPLEIAYLTGGPRLAVHAALAGLRADRSVEAGPGGALTTVPGQPVPAGDLLSAVHAAAGRGMTVRTLMADQGVAGAVGRLRESLERHGWLLGPASRARQRRAGYLMLAVATLGVARLVADSTAGSPVGVLPAAVVVVALAGVFLLLPVPPVKAPDQELLASLRRTHAHLSPAHSPAWTLYGANDAQLAVALYGTAAFRAADPVFAELAGIGQHRPLSAVGGASAARSGRPLPASGGGGCGGYAGSGSDDGGSGGGGSGACGGGGGCGGGG